MRWVDRFLLLVLVYWKVKYVAPIIQKSIQQITIYYISQEFLAL